MFESTIDFIKSTFKTDEFLPLQEPRFIGNENTGLFPLREYWLDIDE